MHQTERTISVIFGTSFEVGPHWPARLFRSVGPKCPVPFDKIVVPSTVLLYSATKRAVAWVGYLQPGGTVPLGRWNFRNFKPENCWMESAHWIHTTVGCKVGDPVFVLWPCFRPRLVLEDTSFFIDGGWGTTFAHHPSCLTSNTLHQPSKLQIIFS